MQHTEQKECISTLDLYLAQDREIPAYISAYLEKLSKETPYGIGLSQLETPMMKQWLAAKKEIPDAILFFRMGDFFELFGADAIIAGDICGLTVTSRDRNSDNPVPMAGIPASSYKSALKKCVLAGFKVTVCDQVEDPRLAKGIVKREIVRISTPAVPGDLNDDDSDERNGCYLAALHPSPAGWSLAYVDVSTGDFRLTGGLSENNLVEELLTVSPREILVCSTKLQSVKQKVQQIFSKIPVVTATENWIWRSETDCKALFEEFFSPVDLHKFNVLNVNFGLQIVTSILTYLKNTQRNILQNLKKIEYYELTNYLLLDDATKRHLDFFSTATNERKGSLFWFLNKCLTSAGERKLARRLNYPFANLENILASHNCVAELAERMSLYTDICNNLRGNSDIERLVSKTAQNSIEPRGLSLLTKTLQKANYIQTLLVNCDALSTSLKEFASNYTVSFTEITELITHLNAALVEDPPPLLGKGGRVFQVGFSSELDDLTNLEENFDKLIQELEDKEKAVSQISNLKIGYSRSFGYFFEVSKGKLGQVPAHFVRKQTLTNGERYITAELKELEDKALSASEKRIILERDLFEQVRQKILQFVVSLENVADFVASIDLLCAFAALAIANNWCKPELLDEAYTHLENNVHPILNALSTAREPFIANNITVGKSLTQELENSAIKNIEVCPQILLITGPNMAGKSTIMRQVAIAQILAQMGSFVPASVAKMGICDKIFTRIGSSDFALRNQSTFMVEMLECTRMLANATSKSLLLMDELGRGTSTYDGLSLAWAILEDIAQRIQVRTLFSTHYHELLGVCDTYLNIQPMQMEVMEFNNSDNTGRKILFSRKFIAGAAGKSYGLHVAELAGIPTHIIKRAENILASLTESKPIVVTKINEFIENERENNCSIENIAYLNRRGALSLSTNSNRKRLKDENKPKSSLFDL